MPLHPLNQGHKADTKEILWIYARRATRSYWDYWNFNGLCCLRCKRQEKRHAACNAPSTSSKLHSLCTIITTSTSRRLSTCTVLRMTTGWAIGATYLGTTGYFPTLRQPIPSTFYHLLSPAVAIHGTESSTGTQSSGTQSWHKLRGPEFRLSCAQAKVKRIRMSLDSLTLAISLMQDLHNN